MLLLNELVLEEFGRPSKLTFGSLKYNETPWRNANGDKRILESLAGLGVQTLVWQSSDTRVPMPLS
jgi:hypothetical protein